MANKIQTFNNRHSDTFCIKPFTEVATTTLGGVKLCCRSGSIDFREYYSKEKTIDNVFKTNKGLVQARKDLLAGKKIKECQACWNDEQAGKVSMRINATENFEKNDPQFIKDIKEFGKTEIKSIDVKFGNKCNYACVMCAPSNSSLWGKEVEKNPMDKDLGHDGFDDHTSLIDFPEHKYQELLDISKSIMRVKSTGGEPMLLDQFKDYIKLLVDKGYARNMTFTTVTNGTIDCTDLLPYMNQFKRFNLNWSVDGTGEVYNYVRWPGNFDRMRRIHERLATEIINKNYNRIHISMHPTIQIFNVHNIPEMIQYAKDLQVVRYVEFGHIFEKPSCLNTSIIPDDMLNVIMKQNNEKVSKIKQTKNFRYLYDDIVATISTDQELYNKKYNKHELFDKTKRMVKWFDQTRNLNVYDHISIYKELANYYK